MVILSKLLIEFVDASSDKEKRTSRLRQGSIDSDQVKPKTILCAQVKWTTTLSHCLALPTRSMPSPMVKALAAPARALALGRWGPVIADAGSKRDPRRERLRLCQTRQRWTPASLSVISFAAQLRVCPAPDRDRTAEDGAP